MAVMKLLIFFFTLSPLLGAHHARHLHDGCIYQIFDRRPPVKTMEVIQMVTGKEEQQSTPIPPPSSSWEVAPSQGKTDYGGENLEGRPSPTRPPSDGDTIFGGDNPKAPFLAKVAPSQDQTVYGGDYLNAQPSPKPGKSGGEAVLGRDNPIATPSPSPSLVKLLFLQIFQLHRHYIPIFQRSGQHTAEMIQLAPSMAGEIKFR